MLRLLRAFAAAATLVACSTVLDISADPNDLPPEGGPNSEGGSNTGDAAVGEPACSLAVDRENVDFGESLINEIQKETLTVRNFSTTPISANVVVSGAGFAVQQARVDVPAMGAQAVTVTYEGKVAQQPQGSVTFEYRPGCPVMTQLKAHTLTSGFTVSPGTLDLGSFACGTDPPDGKIIVKAGNVAMWQATLQAGAPGSPFSLPSSSGQLVAGVNSILVQATPVIPLTTPHAETRTVTVTFPGTTEPARDVVVTTKSLGASLGLSKTGLLLSTADRFGFLTISNNGNEPVTVLLSIGLPFSIQGGNNLAIHPGTPQSFVVEYNGDNAGDQMMTITALTGTICAKESLRVRTTTAF